MKRALLLHGTGGNSNSNWLPWLKGQLEAAGWQVWVPDLPMAGEPNLTRYTDFLLQNRDWVYDHDTYIVGHSSGSIAALGLLQLLPAGSVVKECILVGSFKDDLGWPNLSGLFERPFDFDAIKAHAEQFTFVHSDNDPYCPLEHAEYLSEMVGGTLTVYPGQKHFSAETDPKYTVFPELLEMLLVDE